MNLLQNEIKDFIILRHTMIDTMIKVFDNSEIETAHLCSDQLVQYHHSLTNETRFTETSISVVKSAVITIFSR
jgi:hypothetical protein